MSQCCLREAVPPFYLSGDGVKEEVRGCVGLTGKGHIHASLEGEIRNNNDYNNNLF